MTTIATDGKTIAYDGQITVNSIVVETDFKKCRRITRGKYAGFYVAHAGHMGYLPQIEEWISGTRKRLPSLCSDQNNTVLVGYTGAYVLHYPTSDFINTSLPLTMGSGWEIALGAIHAGASPERAVKIAAQLDTLTGGEITVIKLPGNNR